MNKNKKPHLPAFLGIGAARSGTTWLAEGLSRHPDIWLPRVKEIHYFTRSAKYVGPSQLQDGTVLQRLFSGDKGFRRYRRKLLRAAASNLAHPSFDKLSWDANYLLHRPSDDWYASLFAQGYGKTTGEITPRYCVMDLDDIRSVKALMPGARIIFIMRDPVERAWSLLRYHEKRQGEAFTSLPVAKQIARAMHPAIFEQNDYEGILERWRSVFPAGQFLAAFFDDIERRPDALLARVYDFLDVEVLPSARAAAPGGKVNASFDREMSPELREHLVAFYTPMVERLASAEGGYFKAWLERYDRPAAAPLYRQPSDALQFGDRIA